MKKSIIIFLLVTIALFGNDKQWSPYLGKYSWDVAKQKCEKLGMRLPTITELKFVYDHGSEKFWNLDTSDYWSIEEVNDNNARLLAVSGQYAGSDYDGSKKKKYDTRCINEKNNPIAENDLKKQKDLEEKFLSEETTTDIDESDKSKQNEEQSDNMKLFQASINICKKFLSNISEYAKDYEDNTALQNKKEKLFKQKLVELNKKHKGEYINLPYVCFIDSKPETTLTSYGKNEVKKYIKLLKSTPDGRAFLSIYGSNPEENPLLLLSISIKLAFCDKCRQETGKYEISFGIPSPPSSYASEEEKTNPVECEGQWETWMNYVIRKTGVSEKEAIKYKKNKGYGINGNVNSFSIGDPDLKMNIYLK